MKMLEEEQTIKTFKVEREVEGTSEKEYIKATYDSKEPDKIDIEIFNITLLGMFDCDRKHSRFSLSFDEFNTLASKLQEVKYR